MATSSWTLLPVEGQPKELQDVKSVEQGLSGVSSQLKKASATGHKERIDLAALQKHASKILHLVEIMAKDSPFPCFKNGPACVDKMRARLKLNLTTKAQVANHVAELVKQSYNAYGTRQYDSFQYLTNGIYS